MQTIVHALERSRQLLDYLDEDDFDGAALRAEIEAALNEARRLAGRNQPPEMTSLELHARIRREIDLAGSCAAWGRKVGVGKSYAHQVYNGERPPSDLVLAALGLRRIRRDRFVEA
jgi:hypothetical protein